MTSTTPTHFQVAANLPLDEYQKLWDAAISKVRLLLSDLRRSRSPSDIAGYIDKLNDFDLLTTQEDLNGRIWKDVHPHGVFRDAASKVFAAFEEIKSESKSSPEIAFNVDLYLSAAVSGLTASDSQRLMRKWKKDLTKGGAYLAPSERIKVASLTKAIHEEEQKFLQNIVVDPPLLKLDLNELRGLPADYLAAHPVQPDGKAHISCKMTDAWPIMDYCQVRETREKMFRMRRNQTPVNGPVLLRLLALRQEKATRLGYANWAEYQLEGMTLKTPGAVDDFLGKVFQTLKPQADWEKQQIDNILQEKEGIIAQPWDLRYGTSLLKAHLLPGFDPAQAREFFRVDTVFLSLKEIVENSFDLRFTPDPTVTTWDPSVTVCNVYDCFKKEDKLIGRIFFDLFARDGKVDGSAEYSMRPPVTGKQLAEVVIFDNISSEVNACLSFQECKDLLHELGHCVHCLVGEQRYAQFAGIGEPAAQKDFTEAPGLMLELWLEDKASFGFAVNRHGKRISEALLDQLLVADKLGRGMTDRNWLLVKAKYAVSS